MGRILKSYLFWTYPRGSFHYDVMVTLILAFLFLSPLVINYHERPQETLTSTSSVLVKTAGADALIYDIGADQIAGGAQSGTRGDREGGIAEADRGDLRQRADRPLQRPKGCQRPGDDVSRLGASLERMARGNGERK